jgi:hypothetical protein
VAAVGLDEREQRAAQLDLAPEVGVLGGLGGRVGRCHDVIP